MVEDDLITQKALRKILLRKGWEVIAVAKIADALSLLDEQAENFQFAVLDLMLPDGNGLTVLQAIREANLPIRVVVTTGCADPTDLARVRALDPFAMMTKPIQLNELFEVLNSKA